MEVEHSSETSENHLLEHTASTRKVGGPVKLANCIREVLSSNPGRASTILAEVFRSPLSSSK
jgi:hypothetical protein